MNLRAKLFTVVLGAFLMAGMLAGAQDVEPRKSPYAEVMQRIHTTDVKMTYHRPGVKGREIWGALVPYDSEKPWRAGANNATTFSANKDVKIEGKVLPAGTYSFYIDVNENEKWTVIFNKVADTWGSYDYDSSKDALRINVKPEKIDFKEWLTYGFSDLTEKTADCKMMWDELKVQFTVEAVE